MQIELRWSICRCMNECLKSIWSFQILEKADKMGIKLVSLNIKFEHKKPKSKYTMSTFRSILSPDVS